jgi:multidrug efflux pump subunit AcrA (membrane-fusion protein)
MRFLRQSLMGLFLAAVTLGLLAYAAQMVLSAIEARRAEERPAPPPQERVFAVAVQEAVPGREAPVLEAYGEIRAARRLELRAAAAGRVVEMSPAFVEGGAVREGDVLVRIDPVEAEAARDRIAADLADARAEVRDAEAGLDLARDELAAAEDQVALQDRAFTRQTDLESRGVATAAAVEAAEMALSSARQAVLSRRSALQQAEARVALAATRLRRAEIALEEADRRVEDTVLVAPFDGVLSDVVQAQGRLVSESEMLATLIDPASLEVAFRLSTAQYARLLDGAGDLPKLPVEARLDVAGIDLVAYGRIARDSAAVGEAQTGRLVFATLTNARAFKPGDFVTVRVEEPALGGVVRLPAAALDGSGTVLALGEGDRLEALEVELVRRQGNDVLLRGDALPGREIVVARTPLLGAGIRVRPVRRDADGAALVEPPDMLELSEERRARLIAFVEGNSRMPEEVKARVLARLTETRVPLEMVERLESRMGG